MNADRPTPNSDKREPRRDLVGLQRQRHHREHQRQRRARAACPRPTPSHGDLVVAVTMNATTAPTSIMPSTPRFSTPDFSVTSSPSAAYTSGVPAASVRRRSWATVSISQGGPQPDAIRATAQRHARRAAGSG